MTAATPIRIDLSRERIFALTFDRQIEDREIVWLGVEAIGDIVRNGGGGWSYSLIFSTRSRRARTVEEARDCARAQITDWLHALATPRCAIRDHTSRRSAR